MTLTTRVSLLLLLMLPVGGLDTYEAILDNVHFPALGSSEDDARQCLQSWLDKFTEGYKLRRFYLKKRSAKEEEAV